jgi:Fe2+ transport system protein FeoA
VKASLARAFAARYVFESDFQYDERIMTQVALLSFDVVVAPPSGDATPAELSAVAVGSTGEVIELALEPELAGWLRAVGISEGERVTVLRRAAFGGPIHVRTSSGGEFALHRALAASVMTRAAPP